MGPGEIDDGDCSQDRDRFKPRESRADEPRIRNRNYDERPYSSTPG
jgi:hypothetical protein